MSGRLSAKVCVITGTGGSLGRATALTPCRLDDPADDEALIELALGTYRGVDELFDLSRPSRTRSGRTPCLARRCWVASAGLRKSRTRHCASSYVTGIDVVVDGGMKVW
jgi:NAD(P)-dependent dehydrogenase (short-subunit alcohol dehydrogenase family)